MIYLLKNIKEVDQGMGYVAQISGSLLRVQGEMVSKMVSMHLVKHYMKGLDNISEKLGYELADTLSFVIGCARYGDQSLFEEVAKGLEEKLIEVLRVSCEKQEV